MQKGLVSIVIPTYNDDPRHLAESVASAQAQTYPNVEIVVVDDGSLSPVVIEGVRVIRQDNNGPSAARNLGFASTSGEFLLPLDADNIISPNLAQAGVEALKASRDVLVAYPEVHQFGEGGEQPLSIPEKVTLHDIAVVNRIDTCAVFRREDFLTVGGYDVRAPGLEDWHLWLSMLLQIKGVMRKTQSCLYYRKRHGSRNAVLAEDATRDAWLHTFRSHPGSREEYFLAVAEVALQLQREVGELRAFRNAWGPRVAPLLRVRDRLEGAASILRKSVGSPKE